MDPTRQNYKGPTRWLADSAFTTYFGKPAFHTYGKGNTNPVVGGNIYGQYMLSHNVNPESGRNLPQYQQVYPNALKYGLQKGTRQPELPRKPTPVHGAKPAEPEVKTVADTKRNPIMPADGPRTIAEKVGLDKAPRIKINPPIVEKKPPVAAKRQKSPKKKAKKQHHAAAEENGTAPQPEERQVYSHVDFAIDEDQDIGDADEEDTTTEQQETAPNENVDFTNQLPQQHQEYVALCEHPTGHKVDVKELDPRSYQFAPACWIQRIRPAGRATFRSEQLYNVLTQNQ